MPKGVFVRKPMPAEERAKRSAQLARIRVLRHTPVTDAQVTDRLMNRIVVDERGCWIWQGTKNCWGYGEVSVRHKKWMTHRIFYTLLVGPIPPDGKHGRTVLCHTCDIPACCNPKHLWPGTEKQNLQDAARKRRWPRQLRTHCPKGHPYAGDNLTLSNGGKRRGCKACQRGRQRVEMGWPDDLAYSLPVQPLGYTINPNHPRNTNRGSFQPKDSQP